MALETLQGVTELGGFKVVVMDELRAKFPEKFNESGSMDYKWFEADIRPHNITGFTLTQVNANIVEKMFGHDLDYLLTCSLSSFERFRPLDDWELLDLKKYQTVNS